MEALSWVLLRIPAIGAAASMVAGPQTVTVSMDHDVLVLMKIGIWVVGLLFVAFASIGVAFFGWDVRRARASIMDAQKETQDLLKGLQAGFAEFNALKEKLEQLGAQLEETENVEPEAPPAGGKSERSRIELIRDIIESGNYEWTTIDRIARRSALSREEILDEIRKDPGIHISKGRKTQDFIFKLSTDG